MKELLKNQMEFEYWANSELLVKLKEADPLNDRALLLYSHIMSVNSIWLQRIKGEPVITILFQERTLAECEALLQTNFENWNNFISEAKEEVFQENIQFHFPIDNTIRTMVVADSVFHITNHSSYHRGQIVILIKGSVAALPNLGYVFFSSKIA